MGHQVKPVLLRPSAALADAMTAVAEDQGLSRQEWMLGWLEHAVLADGGTLDADPSVHTEPLPLEA
jgi:hypothetical protein